MEAGRELDALIAEKVMGLTLGPAPMSANFEITCVKLGDHEWRNISYYSTEIGAAWEVVEKLRGAGWTFHVDDVGFNDATEGEWRVMFTEATTGNEHVFADGKTAPHAICLAALKAVEVATVTDPK